MKRRSVVLMLATLPVAAHAQAQSAQAFLEQVYAPYGTKGYNGQDYHQADRFFDRDELQRHHLIR